VTAIVNPNSSTSMKNSLRNALVGLSVIILVLMLPAGWAAVKRYQLSHSDHVRILLACREALENRNSYRNDKDKWVTAEENDVVLLRPIPENFPEAIRQLHPRYVLIKKNCVIIRFTAPFARICLLGFAPGARQYGTRRYIDGLWFWDGNDTTMGDTGTP
jgi:hypothetical protein